MPELPEVETVARGANTLVRGDRIEAVWFSSHREPFKTPARRQARELEGRTILGVARAGKHIVCSLGVPGSRNGAGTDAQWIVHLGMTGQLLVAQPGASVAAHTHVRLALASGRELRFVDPRRFGRLEFRRLGKDGTGFLAPGAEPLEIGGEDFAALFRGRKASIKALLLNQSLLAGVGNIYADESLFRAGLRPTRKAGRLSKIDLERLRAALRQVLKDAIRLGGSSISDYVDAQGSRGSFQLEHQVYQRTGQPCHTCQTLIQRVVIAGRSTHYCPKCQG